MIRSLNPSEPLTEKSWRDRALGGQKRRRSGAGTGIWGAETGAGVAGGPPILSAAASTEREIGDKSRMRKRFSQDESFEEV